MGAISLIEKESRDTKRVSIGSIAHEKKVLRFVWESLLELRCKDIDINYPSTKDVYHRQPSDSSISDHEYQRKHTEKDKHVHNALQHPH